MAVPSTADALKFAQRPLTAQRASQPPNLRAGQHQPPAIHAALRCPAGQAWAHKGAPVWLVHARQARVPPVLPHAHQRAAPAPRSLRGCPPACTRPLPPAPQWCLRTARGPGGAGQQVEKVFFPLHGQQYGHSSLQSPRKNSLLHSLPCTLPPTPALHPPSTASVSQLK